MNGDRRSEIEKEAVRKIATQAEISTVFERLQGLRRNFEHGASDPVRNKKIENELAGFSHLLGSLNESLAKLD